jgi:dTDP-4-amino-4,6-dideoxy-D-galactose acyltransferase
MDAPCKFLDWDSDFFGFRIGRVEGDSLTDATLDAILRWCSDREVDCLYFLCASDDDRSVQIAERNHFHLVDIKLELSWRAQTGETPPRRETRLFQPTDLPSLQEIAANSYDLSRFYFDRRFPREKASGLYREWVTKSCDGLADAVFVAGQQTVGGFITCRLETPERGRIGLLGVAETARGAGISRALIETAQRYFSDRGARDVFVVTQARNIAAQRAYQACGFRTHSVSLWYHKWFMRND